MKKYFLYTLIVIFVFFICINYVNASSLINILEAPSVPNIEGVSGVKTCSQLLGANLVKVVHASVRIIQIAGAIITIVKGMMILIPPIISKDASALNKAASTLVTMSIILAIIFLFPTILRVIGKIADFDISCIF